MANRKPLAQRAAEGILDYIRTNDMKPGDRLPTEQELTQLLEVGHQLDVACTAGQVHG